MDRLITATPVITVGGPTGPYVGAAGFVGAPGPAVFGATGMAGIAGAMGQTGPQGMAGAFSALFGATGKTGPLGAEGYFGPAGPKGRMNAIPVEQTAYFENSQGVAGFNTYGVWAGCKFLYTSKKTTSGMMVVLMSGLLVCTVGRTVGIEMGIGWNTPPPNVGSSDGFPEHLTIFAPIHDPPYALPFFFVNAVGVRVDDLNPPGKAFWFDIAAASGTSTFDPAGNAVKNINCVVMEF